MNPKKTSWGAVAKWYDDLLEEGDDSYQKKVIMPNLIRIVDPKPGMELLDIACGQGYFARAFALNGAKVSACDISSELIELAKKNTDAIVDYHVAPADKLKAADSAFDLAIIVLAIQNVENINGAFAEAYRALKPGGRFILVINHPAFRIPKSSSWQWDEETKSQYRRIDSYMSEAQNKIDMTPGQAENYKKRFTVTFHRPLQIFVKSLTRSGFVLTRLEEWLSHKKSQPGPKSAEEDRIRKEIPMFMCLECLKR